MTEDQRYLMLADIAEDLLYAGPGSRPMMANITWTYRCWANCLAGCDAHLAMGGPIVMEFPTRMFS